MFFFQNFIKISSHHFRFAQRAKTIKNKPQVNEICTDTALMKRYAQKITTLKKELDKQNSVNRNLEIDQEKKNRVINELMERIQILERTYVSFDINKSQNKRRHTIAFSHSKPLLQPISEEFQILTHLEDVTPLEQFELDLIEAQKEKQNLEFIDKNTLIEESELEICNNNTPKSSKINNGREFGDHSTPKASLRSRIQYLQEELEELQEYTNLENKIFEKETVCLLFQLDYYFFI